jgi:methionyl-tRNA formyltransferase
LRLIPGPAKALDTSDTSDAGVAPGTVLEAVGDRLVLAAASGAVALQSIQPAGKVVMSIAEFLRGYRVQPGERFGAEL